MQNLGRYILELGAAALVITAVAVGGIVAFRLWAAGVI